MQYLVSFLEGIITFISPCLLPMLPVYITWFAGGGERTTRKTLTNAAGFVLGFSLVFMAMGALAGTLGGFLSQHQQFVNLLCGLVVVFFGLTYLGVVKINLFKGGFRKKSGELGFFSALAFGVVFSVGWTPCVGVFLGSALMLAGQQGTMVTGLTLLLCYSLGLGIPFLVSAVVVDKLKSAFGFIKQHYGIINKVCGGLLVLMGILMATGLFERLTRLLS